MSFLAECPFCGTLLQNVPRQFAGQSRKCPRCRSYITLSPLLGPPRPRPAREKASAPVDATPALSAVGAGGVVAPRANGVESLAAPILPEPVAENVPGERAAPAPDTLAPTPPRTNPINYPGVFSFLFGSLAVLAWSVPAASEWVVPLSGLGVFCGAVGLLWSAGRPGGRRLTSVGIGVSLPALLLGLFWPSVHVPAPKTEPLIANAPPLAVHLGPRTGRAIVPLEGEWADASVDAVQQGDVRVRITSAEVKRPELTHAKGPRLSPEKYLVIRLRISNAGTSRIIDYSGWGLAGPKPDTAARLSDSQGKAYRLHSVGSVLKIPGQVQQAAFAPGKWIEDVLVFEAPAADVKFVRLELPCAACGGSGELHLEIPRRMVQFR